MHQEAYRHGKLHGSVSYLSPRGLSTRVLCTIRVSRSLRLVSLTVSPRVSGSQPCASTSLTMPKMYAKTSSSSSFTAPSWALTTSLTAASLDDIPPLTDAVPCALRNTLRN